MLSKKGEKGSSSEKKNQEARERERERERKRKQASKHARNRESKQASLGESPGNSYFGCLLFRSSFFIVALHDLSAACP
jgi:hypothetical protein